MSDYDTRTVFTFRLGVRVRAEGGTPRPVRMTVEESMDEFSNLRKRLDMPAHEPVLLELADIANELDKVNAKDAARRVRQLDSFAAALPPETLPRLVDSSSALDELEETLGKRAASLGLARNIFALLPLLLTWFSLWQATSAYHAQIQADPQKVYQPFLLLWEGRFGGRLAGLWPTFSQTAMLDLGLLLVVVLLTWCVQRTDDDVRKRGRQLVARLDAGVITLVAALGEVYANVSKNPGEWAAEVERVINKAMSETRALSKLNATALEAAKEAIASAAQRHHDLVHDLGHEVREALQKMREANEQIVHVAAEEARNIFVQANDAHQTLAKKSLVAVAAAQNAIESVKLDSEQFLRDLHEADRQYLADADKAGRERLLEASTRAYEQLDRHLETVKRFGSDIERFQRGTEGLITAIPKVGEASEQLGRTASAFSRATEDMATNVRAMVEEQKHFTGRLTSAAGEMQKAATEMGNATGQVSNVVTKISSDLAPKLESMGTQVTVASGSLANTQTKLSKAADGLQSVADELGRIKRPMFGWVIAKLR